MNIFEQIGSMIHDAAEKFQNCPICGIAILPEQVGGNADGLYYAHGCDCWFEVSMARDKLNEGFFDVDLYNRFINVKGNVDEQNIKANYFTILSKVYKKYCHKCKLPGVDSLLKGCVEDPPYKYKCIYCGHSLRTHYLFGEGMPRDMAK